MVLIERTTAGVIERRLFRGDLGIDLGIGMAVTCFLGFAPMGVVGIVGLPFAQCHHRQLQLDL